MLESIPPEILSIVGYHLSIDTLQPPTSLLSSSKYLNECLSPRSNPNLYARIYRDSFDTSAAVRRCTDDLTARKLTAELEHRTRALGRLKRRVRDGKVGEVEESDLWVIYILLIEHDEKNLSHLFSREFGLIDFLKAYHTQNFLPGALETGYPTETVGRSLVMWIAWVLFHHGIGREETSKEEMERLFILRPYVFAAQKYDLYYGPWTIHDLPLSTSRLQNPTLETEFDHPFKADLKPKSRGTDVRYYGGVIRMGAPIISHAAILRFFKRDYDEDEDEDGDDDEEMPEEHEATAPIVGQGRSENNATSTIPTSARLRNDSNYTNSYIPTKGGIAMSSQSHDRDWKRLKSCYDAATCPGMKVKDWRNAFEGCWEGNFSFFEFQYFRQMLAGDARALYEGPYGEQAQVWRLTETFIRPIKVQVATPIVDDEIDEGDIGKKDKGKARADPQPEPEVEPRSPIFNGPATNAGFPTDLPSSLSAGLATPSAEQITLRETIKQQVDAIEGYETVPPEELDEAVDKNLEGLEVLLTGTGHSAWGRFVLKGRVRAWDGMATLVKEYAPDSRGKWIYRGYVTAGDAFVGRWRDTFTPEEYYGYEGTFILNRRE